MQSNNSPSQVIKVSEFQGSLSTRALYIYLPRGYHEQIERSYPVLYMHDGQNCFEAFAGDSYTGSWRADETADRLIEAGDMQPCIIVGVSHGQEQRLAEYLPPYAALPPTMRKTLRRTRRPRSDTTPENGSMGRADRTFAYYRDEVHPYICARYRVCNDREQIATCGSSMGGLFSAYIAWEHAEFARHHAIMSPAFWITEAHHSRAGGPFLAIERLRSGPPRDVRLWLDCGSWGGAPGHGNDGRGLILAARDALYAQGYAEGSDFCVFYDEGTIHHESSWAARLDKVFRFLLPPTDRS